MHVTVPHEMVRLERMSDYRVFTVCVYSDKQLILNCLYSFPGRLIYYMCVIYYILYTIYTIIVLLPLHYCSIVYYYCILYNIVLYVCIMRMSYFANKFTTIV